MADIEPTVEDLARSLDEDLEVLMSQDSTLARWMDRESVDGWPAAIRRAIAAEREVAALREESAWIRKKLDLPEDTPFVSGSGSTLAGSMHVVCSHAHGYETYIKAYKCDDKQGEIARLTVENAALREEVQRLRATLKWYADHHDSILRKEALVAIPNYAKQTLEEVDRG